MRRQLLEAPAAVVTGEVLREAAGRHLRLRVFRRRHEDDAVTDRKGVLDAVGNARPALPADDQAVYDDLNGMFASSVDFDRLVERADLAVDPYANVAIGLATSQQCVVGLGLAALDRGAEQN